MRWRSSRCFRIGLSRRLADPVWHVADFHLKYRPMCEGLLHGRIGVLDIQIVCGSHGFVALRGFANHDGRGAELDLHVRDQTVRPQGATDLGAAKTLYQEAHKGFCVGHKKYGVTVLKSGGIYMSDLLCELIKQERERDTLLRSRRRIHHSGSDRGTVCGEKVVR